MSIKSNHNLSTEKKFVGIPYKLGGSSFDGTDCFGIVLLWYKEQGIEFEYNDLINNRMKLFWERRPAEFLSLVSSFGEFIPFHEVRKYDFMLFFPDNKDALFPSFPAVMVDDRYFLSNFDNTESKISMIDMTWKTRFWGAIKIKKAVEMGIR